MTGRQDECSRHFQKNSGGIRQYGFTRYELTVVIIIFSVLTAVLLNRLQYYQEYAERTAVDVTVRNIRNGLRLQVADLMMQDRMSETAKLLKQNPITWLEQPPLNYIGELYAPRDNAIPPGSWYFDLAERHLIYLPSTSGFFDYPLKRNQLIRYRVTALSHLHQKRNAVAKIEGLTLVLIN
jgi:type II secretory pathway pseudopilin PulG